MMEFKIISPEEGQSFICYVGKKNLLFLESWCINFVLILIPIRIQIKTFECSGIIPSQLSLGSIVDV